MRAETNSTGVFSAEDQQQGDRAMECTRILYQEKPKSWLSLAKLLTGTGYPSQARHQAMDPLLTIDDEAMSMHVQR